VYYVSVVGGLNMVCQRCVRMAHLPR